MDKTGPHHEIAQNAHRMLEPQGPTIDNGEGATFQWAADEYGETRRGLASPATSTACGSKTESPSAFETAPAITAGSAAARY